MPEKYGPEAHDLCLELWLQHGGMNHDLIEIGMRKVYPGWSKSNLYDRGKDGERMGWITRDGLDRKLKIHLQTKTEKVRSDEQDLYVGIKNARKALQAKVEAGENAERDALYQYRDFCKLEIEARKNLDLSRDNLETFVSGYEKLAAWAVDIDPQLAKLLAKHGERFAELAQAHYGKAETEFDGASNRADESGNEPFSLLS